MGQRWFDDKCKINRIFYEKVSNGPHLTINHILDPLNNNIYKDIHSHLYIELDNEHEKDYKSAN